MINKISEIHDLGFEFSFKCGKDISIEVSYKPLFYDFHLQYNF